MHGFLASVRYCVRLLLKSPGFAVTAVLILGFGIGANTASSAWLTPSSWSRRGIRIRIGWLTSSCRAKVRLTVFLTILIFLITSLANIAAKERKERKKKSSAAHQLGREEPW